MTTVILIKEIHFFYKKITDVIKISFDILTTDHAPKQMYLL